ncbi:MAG: hypothetical protein ROW52_13095 [Anaerolineaceae bacterium]|jgi:hypothetical protein
MLAIDIETARRFILGRQGLWPGRRWRGSQGAEQAMRATNTFVILGFWLEEEILGKDEAFALALGRGFDRFVKFLGAERLEAKAIAQPVLRQHLL